MRLRALLCALALLLLAGCGAIPQGIPQGLTWTAQTLQSQENRDILAAAEGTSFPDAAPLDVTAQVEGGTITLTDHASGETYTGTLSPRPGRGTQCPDLHPGVSGPAGGLWGVRGHGIHGREPGRHPVPHRGQPDTMPHRPPGGDVIPCQAEKRWKANLLSTFFFI